MQVVTTDHTALFIEHKSTVRTLQRSLQREIAGTTSVRSDVLQTVDDGADSDTSNDSVSSSQTLCADSGNDSAGEQPRLLRAALEYVSDTSTMFRHLKRAQFDANAARANVCETLRWRHSMLVHRPGHWLHRGLLHSGACRVVGRDPHRRQILWLNLHALSGSSATREEVRLFTVGMLEALRLDTRQCFEQHGQLVQCVCVLDLAGVGITSMDSELAPFVLDLLLNRFPSCFAAVYVLNYSWMYAGVWSLIRRFIPEDSRDRVVFPSRTDLCQQLGVEQLPEDATAYDPDRCEFLTLYRQQAMAMQGSDEDNDSADGATADQLHMLTQLDCPASDEDNGDSTDEDESFEEAPLWTDADMHQYSDARIAQLEQQLAAAQQRMRQMEQQLIRVQSTRQVTRYRRLPQLLYALGPRQLNSLFAWFRLSLRVSRQRFMQWWTQRMVGRGMLYWLVALLVTREGVGALLGELVMRTLMEAVHLRGLIGG